MSFGWPAQYRKKNISTKQMMHLMIIMVCLFCSAKYELVLQEQKTKYSVCCITRNSVKTASKTSNLWTFYGFYPVKMYSTQRFLDSKNNDFFLRLRNFNYSLIKDIPHTSLLPKYYISGNILLGRTQNTTDVSFFSFLKNIWGRIQKYI